LKTGALWLAKSLPCLRCKMTSPGQMGPLPPLVVSRVFTEPPRTREASLQGKRVTDFFMYTNTQHQKTTPLLSSLFPFSLTPCLSEACWPMPAHPIDHLHPAGKHCAHRGAAVPLSHPHPCAVHPTHVPRHPAAPSPSCHPIPPCSA